MFIIGIFIINFTKFCVIVSFFLTKSLILDILHSAAVSTVVLTKSVILDISPLTSFILALKEAFVAKLVVLGNLF